MGVPHAAGDDDGADVGGDFGQGRDVACRLGVAGLDDVVHVCFDSEGRVVGVAGLLEELLEDVTEVATALLGFGVRSVGFEHEHFDRFAGHGGLFCWEGGGEEGVFGGLDVRFGEGRGVSVEFA